MTERSKRVVVIGAGYAGLLAAVRLAGKTRRLPVEITLVNASDLFIERLRLHQYAAGQAIESRRIADILEMTDIGFVHGLVANLNAGEREVAVQTKGIVRRLSYDHLVHALGSTIDCDSVPGVREYAYRLTPAGPLSAEALRAALPVLAENGGRVVVVGGGPTGIEAAAEFAETWPSLQVSLITRGEFGAFISPKVAAYMRQSLGRLGVTIRDRTTVARVNAREVITDCGDAHGFDLCLWAGGFAVPSLARQAGLAVNERGQILVDPYLRSISHPEIYAVGDAAYPVEFPGAPVRMAAFPAVLMGAHAADCLSALLNGGSPRPFGFAWLGQGIALGRRDAVGMNNFPDDRQRGPLITGRVGVQVREFFVRYLAAAPLLERRWPGFFFWLGKSRGSGAIQTQRQRVEAPMSIDQ
ncbi:MAG: FAD-dependent oxidoreductase [Acidobacteria bacterium]|nr:FAD-dependent oxidoreductase [Acidobacteriota bacterium]